MKLARVYWFFIVGVAVSILSCSDVAPPPTTTTTPNGGPESMSATLKTGLVSYWILTSDAEDSLGNNNGTWSGVEAYATGKVESTAATLASGDSSYINCGNLGNTLPDSDDDRTITAWVYPVSTNAGNDLMTVVGWGTDAGHQLSEIVLTNQSLTDNKIEFHGNGDDHYSSADIPFDQWTFIAVTVSASDQIKFYINGVLDSTTTATSVATVGTTCAISRQPDCPGCGQYFIGKLEQIGVWGRALSATEISELYNEGNGLTY